MTKETNKIVAVREKPAQNEKRIAQYAVELNSAV